jgi:hypothetical protein
MDHQHDSSKALKQCHELIDAYTGLTNDGSESASVELIVERYHNPCRQCFSPQDNIAASLPYDNVPDRLQSSDALVS